MISIQHYYDNGKWFICVSRLKNKIPTLELFKPYITNKHMTEKYIYLNSCKYRNYTTRWSDWMNII